MDIRNIPAGDEPPWDLNVIVEIPEGGEPVKYEIDPELGLLRVDRFLHTTMRYPGSYGFVPNTRTGDGDPLDVLVVGQPPVVPGALLRARPVGALVMRDEAGDDTKILALPVGALNPAYASARSCEDLPELLLQRVAHFFRHYKDLEAPTKWVTEPRWASAHEAADLITEAVSRAAQAR